MAEPLLPLVDEESRPFWEATRRGELRIQACGRCGRLRHPPRTMCPWCHATDRTWVPVSGRGRIWSFVVPHPPLLEYFAELAPYNVVLVELEEDPTIRLVGNLVTRPDGPINEVDPSTITIGAPVRVLFCPLTDDIVMPRWVLAGPH